MHNGKSTVDRTVEASLQEQKFPVCSNRCSVQRFLRCVAASYVKVPYAVCDFQAHERESALLNFALAYNLVSVASHCIDQQFPKRRLLCSRKAFSGVSGAFRPPGSLLSEPPVVPELCAGQPCLLWKSGQKACWGNGKGKWLASTNFGGDWRHGGEVTVSSVHPGTDEHQTDVLMGVGYHRTDLAHRLERGPV